MSYHGSYSYFYQVLKGSFEMILNVCHRLSILLSNKCDGMCLHLHQYSMLIFSFLLNTLAKLMSYLEKLNTWIGSFTPNSFFTAIFGTPQVFSCLNIKIQLPNSKLNQQKTSSYLFSSYISMLSLFSIFYTSNPQIHTFIIKLYTLGC